MKQFIRKWLHGMTYLWVAARHYVRYAPRGAVSVYLNAQVDEYFRWRPYRYSAATRGGFSITGETSDLIQRFIYLYGVWEPDLTQWLTSRLRRGDGFVDVGANIGYFSLLAAKLVGPEGRVVSVEASPSIFAKLAANANRNGFTNVRLVNEAAYDRESSLSVFRAPGWNLGATSIYEGNGFETEATVSARPLSAILSPDEIRRARIIKIDVEGAEVEATRGLLPALSDSREDLEIIVEVGGGPQSAPAAQSDEIIHLLSKKGFNVYRINNSYDPKSYIRENLDRPKRCHGAIVGETDIIFSRVYAPYL